MSVRLGYAILFILFEGLPLIWQGMPSTPLAARHCTNWLQLPWMEGFYSPSDRMERLAPYGLHARAKEPAISDRVSLLYSSQVHFDPKGIPLVTVGIMEACKKVGISSDHALKLSVAQPKGPKLNTMLEIPPGEKWTFQLDQGSAGKVSYWVGVDSIPLESKKRLAIIVEDWHQRGEKPQVFEVGSVFGLRGQVIDNRSYIVGINSHSNKEHARRAAVRVFSRYGTKTFIHAHLSHRPTGTIWVLDQEGRLVVVAKDLITISSPNGSGSIVVHDLGRVKEAEWRGAAVRRYAGTILLTLDHDGRMVVVNRIGVERLLEGLVPAEMYPEAPLEALKAQAVVARGEVFAKIGSRHFLDPYLLCASTHCQVYAGVDVEHPRTTQAIRATRGELLFRDSDLVDSVYSASCGGHTEDNELVWSDPANPALRGRPDMPKKFAGQWNLIGDRLGDWLKSWPPAFCNISTFRGRESFRWTHTINSSKMDRLAAKVKPVGQVVSIQVLSRGVSGRAMLVRVVGTKGEFVVRRELPIRKLFGGLKSAMFEVEVVTDEEQMPSAFQFRGGGWGHGVGMCQMGAIGMAELGYDYHQILAHYYQDAKVFKLYGKIELD